MAGVNDPGPVHRWAHRHGIARLLSESWWCGKFTRVDVQTMLPIRRLATFAANRYELGVIGRERTGRWAWRWQLAPKGPKR
jgi:hypothetical protein